MSGAPPDRPGVSFLQKFSSSKGSTSFLPNQSFLLHVIWQAPSAAAAQELLSGLSACAAATHRDTPCVPTYFFRVSPSFSDVSCPPPLLLKDHPHIAQAHRKLLMGIPSPAIRAELSRRRLPPDIIDLDPQHELPAELRTQPVMVEFTEVYLDEAAFMAHSASRQFLDGYAVVMDPSLHYTVPQTLRIGTPSQNMIDTILEPVLKEQVVANAGAIIFRAPPVPPRLSSLLSFDVSQPPAAAPCQDAIQSLPSALLSACTTCVCFPHPLRPACLRFVVIFPSLPPACALAELRSVVQRGELHVPEGDDDALELARCLLQEAMLTSVTAHASCQAGHILHQRSSELQPSH